jgi:hypothetical protein
MNLIRFFIPVLLAATCIITSCKKNEPGKSDLVDTLITLPPDNPDKPVVVDSSKLLPSVIFYYNSSDSLIASDNYTYDNNNRITKLVTMAHGNITNSQTFSYDVNGNLTNITETSPNAISVIIPNVAPVTTIDTTYSVFHYTNNLPDSIVITGSRIYKEVIKYVIENNRINTLKTFIYTEMSIGIVGASPTPPKIRIDSTIINYVYTGDVLTQITRNNEKNELTYSSHKSAFYNVDEKWSWVTATGFIMHPAGIHNHDVIKTTITLTNELINYTYSSLYNQYDYPIQTEFSGSAQFPGGSPSTTTVIPLTIKYKYILAK